MKIAQVSPLCERVPPKLYGGTERIVSYLTEELVRQGHEVTLFASGDSLTSARLISCWNKALRLDSRCFDQLLPHVLQLELVQQHLQEFDVIHYHSDYIHLPLARRAGKPYLSTLHGRMNIPEYKPLFREYVEAPLVSISNSQRQPLPGANWIGTVYHGLPADLCSFHEKEGSYLAFLGRISPEKRVDRAIDIARRVQLPLKIAAKVDPADQQYYDRHIRHLMDDPLVEFIGEIGDEQKSDFLGNALALLFPIDWPEPFGLVMIEAMACGTPVIAYQQGSVPEIIEHGKTGFVVNSQEEAAAAVQQLYKINRRLCRETFEKRFSVERMAADYVTLYSQQIEVAALKKSLYEHTSL
jgi:glycosyltransferase involved in cell wall biosynthesis